MMNRYMPLTGHDCTIPALQLIDGQGYGGFDLWSGRWGHNYASSKLSVILYSTVPSCSTSATELLSGFVSTGQNTV